MLAPRSPTITQMDECSLVFVHRIKREKTDTFITLKPISPKGFFVLEKDLFFNKDRFFRSQNYNCGLFYPAKSLLADGIFHFVRNDGR